MTVAAVFFAAIVTALVGWTLLQPNVVSCLERMQAAETFAQEVHHFRSRAGRNPRSDEVHVPDGVRMYMDEGRVRLSLEWGFDEWYEFDVDSGAWDSIFGDGAERCRRQ